MRVKKKKMIVRHHDVKLWNVVEIQIEIINSTRSGEKKTRFATNDFLFSWTRQLLSCEFRIRGISKRLIGVRQIIENKKLKKGDVESIATNEKYKIKKIKK